MAALCLTRVTRCGADNLYAPLALLREKSEHVAKPKKSLRALNDWEAVCVNGKCPLCDRPSESRHGCPEWRCEAVIFGVVLLSFAAVAAVLIQFRMTLPGVKGVLLLPDDMVVGSGNDSNNTSSGGNGSLEGQRSDDSHAKVALVLHRGPNVFRTNGNLSDLTKRPTSLVTLSHVCRHGSFAAPAASQLNRPTWAVDPKFEANCYRRVASAFMKSGDPLKASIVQDKRRNWCWVGLKELGCHATLYHARPRMHLSWAQMQAAHQRFVPAPPQPPGAFAPLLNEGLCDRAELGKVQAWTGDDWKKAWAWFSRHVTVYVLNLKADVKRWNDVETVLGRMGIQYNRVEGVDMRIPGSLQKAKHEGLVPHDYDFGYALVKARSIYQAMGGIQGTLGCASAHFRAQTRAYTDARSSIAIVFEDDVQPSPDFVPKLWRLVHEELPCEWQVLSLRSMCPYGACISEHLVRVMPDLNEPADRCRHGTSYGFQGVMYRVSELREVQKQWMRAVFNAAWPHCLDVDVALASISDTVSFFAVPFVQYPGLLTERDEGSTRYSINAR